MFAFIRKPILLIKIWQLFVFLMFWQNLRQAVINFFYQKNEKHVETSNALPPALPKIYQIKKRDMNWTVNFLNSSIPTNNRTNLRFPGFCFQIQPLIKSNGSVLSVVFGVGLIDQLWVTVHPNYYLGRAYISQCKPKRHHTTFNIQLMAHPEEPHIRKGL